MKFGDNLKRFRNSRKISQEALAEKVGVSRQSVSKWETGEAYPEMNNILKLCKIFHCHINDLVNDSIIDTDSLDEEIRMSVVKLKKEKQRKMKGISKIIYVIARSCKIVIVFSIFTIILTMLVIPFLANNVKLDQNTIEFFDESITYQRHSNEIIFEQNNREIKITEDTDFKTFEVILDILENNEMVNVIVFIEIAFIFLIVMLLMLFYTFSYLEKLFINIHNGDTPFTIDNIIYIKRMSYLLIGVILFPKIGGLVSELILQRDLDIEFEFFYLIEILILYSLSYIFEYGYEIQLDSTGRMYGEEYE